MAVSFALDIRTTLLRPIVVAAALLALVAAPLSAADRAETPGPLGAALARLDVRHDNRARGLTRAAAMNVPPAPARDAQSGSAGNDSVPFFRSRTGVIVVAVMAAGVGYAVYSARHDRVRSPGKQ